MQWLIAQRINAKIVVEFDDNALMREFGQASIGIFIAPTIIEAEVV